MKNTIVTVILLLSVSYQNAHASLVSNAKKIGNFAQRSASSHASRFNQRSKTSHQAFISFKKKPQQPLSNSLKAINQPSFFNPYRWYKTYQHHALMKSLAFIRPYDQVVNYAVREPLKPVGTLHDARNALTVMKEARRTIKNHYQTDCTMYLLYDKENKTFYAPSSSLNPAYHAPWAIALPAFIDHLNTFSARGLLSSIPQQETLIDELLSLQNKNPLVVTVTQSSLFDQKLRSHIIQKTLPLISKHVRYDDIPNLLLALERMNKYSYAELKKLCFDVFVYDSKKLILHGYNLQSISSELLHDVLDELAIIRDIRTEDFPILESLEGD